MMLVTLNSGCNYYVVLVKNFYIKIIDCEKECSPIGDNCGVDVYLSMSDRRFVLFKE